MPKTNKKRFIDPRKSVTFEVVPRSQVDPLAADESAPKNVLVEKKSRAIIESEYTSRPMSADKRRAEQQKYGIYFDDDYNYLQHLRDVRVVGEMERVVRVDKTGKQVTIRHGVPEGDEDNMDKSNKPLLRSVNPRITLPSSVFPSHVEERVGLLHKGITHTGPRPDWDPEVMAALDDDFNDDEGELEDDFVALASGGADCIEDLGAGDEELVTRHSYYKERDLGGGAFGNDIDYNMLADSDDGNYDEEGEEDDKLAVMKLANQETRSRFTSYSLSSSVMTRTGGLKTLDDQFEQLFEQEYNSKDVGALDGEEIEGRISIESEVVNKLTEQYAEVVRLSIGGLSTASEGPDEVLKNCVIKSLKRAEEVEELDLVENNHAHNDTKWDCESILSTYSSVHNRPKVIDMPPKSTSKIRLGARGMPVEEKGLTKRALKQLEGNCAIADDYAKSVCSRVSAVSVARSKDETAEERKARKQQVKQFRRERRVEKRANAIAFKAEERRQKVQELNIRNNMQGIKLL
ncbi:protein LTV1-like [Tropilaelaps mercedesae]|uniref:Protein LTV1 homolog n=1 Tax=Tropilaelaps mercedesae TaxID=418985 RepID=A0A1V9X271_9ACAR|nr:protein LTV1-like [Tropilaelaps mercedesae]